MEVKDKFIRYVGIRFSLEEMKKRSKDFYQFMDKRRSLREFSDKPVPQEVIENIIRAASTAPSGAHKQPWFFCVIGNPSIKKKIREAAENEERINYESRMSVRWLKDLEPFETNWEKPFLEIAPWLIIVFKEVFSKGEEGEKHNNYYVNESVGLACGMLLAAIHNAGLVSLTHTPSPMGFLSEILERPQNQRPFLLIPVGYPADKAEVPNLERKELSEIMKMF